MVASPIRSPPKTKFKMKRNKPFQRWPSLQHYTIWNSQIGEMRYSPWKMTEVIERWLNTFDDGWVGVEGWVMERVTWVRAAHKGWVYWLRSRGWLSQRNRSTWLNGTQTTMVSTQKRRGNCRTHNSKTFFYITVFVFKLHNYESVTAYYLWRFRRTEVVSVS